MPTVDWVLLGPGKSNKEGIGLWQPISAACLQDVPFWQEKRVIIIIIILICAVGSGLLGVV